MAYGVDKATLRKEKEIAEHRVKCKCGCTTIMTPKTDWTICRWCKHKLYRTPQLKFKYEMKERLNK